MKAKIDSSNGRPVLWGEGKRHGLACYSPISWRGEFLQRSGPAFFRHGMAFYWLGLPRSKDPALGWGSPFWRGDEIVEHPDIAEFVVNLDNQAAFILENDPAAVLLIRNLPTTAATWNALHTDQLFVAEDGVREDTPSLASGAWWDMAARVSGAAIRYCQSRPWADRIAGYWFGLESEGTMPNLFGGKLFDHSPVMTARWKTWLRERYVTEEALQRAWENQNVTFESVRVPTDPLRGQVPSAAGLLYWSDKYQPLRDYLDLLEKLFHEGVRHSIGLLKAEIGEGGILVVDAFKQAMCGWSNFGFFDANFPMPLKWPDPLAGSGSAGVGELLDLPELDGVVTPLDYQLRGVGGVTEPEGPVDSVVLRGKIFFGECDIRTWNDDLEKGAYGTARNLAEFEAINWRNIASGLTRGYIPYWMDLVGDWFGHEGIQRCIQRSAEVLREASAWPHSTPPGIAMILDDRAVRETNGDADYLARAIGDEFRRGLSRCGVPYRIYLLEDLARADFPEHRVFYFPNLFRATPEKLALLEKAVFRDGKVVVWGPGSGIAGGEIDASALTGFEFESLGVNDPRTVQILDFEHPLTANLDEACFFGGPTSYGPLQTPTSGRILGVCHGKSGKFRGGLAVTERTGWDGSTWYSVFSAAVPLPTALWRNLARFAGGHVYCESNDVLMASNQVVSLHTVKTGFKTISLPGNYRVTDLVANAVLSDSTGTITLEMKSPSTCVFRLESVKH